MNCEYRVDIILLLIVIVILMIRLYMLLFMRGDFKLDLVFIWWYIFFIVLEKDFLVFLCKLEIVIFVVSCIVEEVILVWLEGKLN